MSRFHGEEREKESKQANNIASRMSTIQFPGSRSFLVTLIEPRLGHCVTVAVQLL